MKSWIRPLVLVQILIFSLAQGAAASDAKQVKSVPLSLRERAAQDPGPNPNDPMHRELIDIVARMPYMPGISEALTGEQKFRLIFGPVFWRMILKPNTLKILFIGQDATHIAEAAERTATAGYGGRAQDVANYLGVDLGAGFINTYAYTIYGQAAAFDTPFFVTEGGKTDVRFATMVDNATWLMTYDQASPITRWRNELIDWICRYHRESLRLIVTFGGAARDGAGAFIVGRGGKVGNKMPARDLADVRVPMTESTGAGGNKEFTTLLGRGDGLDLYPLLAGRRLDYKKVEKVEGRDVSVDQEAAKQALRHAMEKDAQGTLARIAFTEGGLKNSGLLDPAQFGYDFDEIEIGGVKSTRNLKDLLLSDGKLFGHDLVIAEFPHPTRLSQMSKKDAAEAIRRGLAPILEYAKRIPPDEGFLNKVAAGIPYEYGRAALRQAFYSFGTPLSRQVGISLASRMSRHPNVIIFGTADGLDFDMARIDEMTAAGPARPIVDEPILTGRPTSPAARYDYDLGPDEEWARLFKKNLDLDLIYAEKPGLSAEKDGIAAYNVKNAPVHSDFGHYRGTFDHPRVLILADPDGADDLITSRALTGARGQYLQGLMRDIGVPERYFLLKTVPFDMDGATDEEYRAVLGQTRAYREGILRKLFAENKFDLILTDGKYAEEELVRIRGGNTEGVPVVNIQRSGRGNAYGIAEAGERIAKLEPFRGAKITGESANIPRAHLTYYAHLWEGTSGDRVITGRDTMISVRDRETGKMKQVLSHGPGYAYAVVAPRWAYGPEVQLDEETARATRALVQRLEDAHLPRPGENAAAYLERQGKATVRTRTPKQTTIACTEKILGGGKSRRTKKAG